MYRTRQNLYSGAHVQTCVVGSELKAESSGSTSASGKLNVVENEPAFQAGAMRPARDSLLTNEWKYEW